MGLYHMLRSYSWEPFRVLQSSRGPRLTLTHQGVVRTFGTQFPEVAVLHKPVLSNIEYSVYIIDKKNKIIGDINYHRVSNIDKVRVHIIESRILSI